MKNYNSIEEFIFINNRYPDSNESRQLYDMLWDKYIRTLSDDCKKIAIENDRLQDYKNNKAANQKEAIDRISKSTEKFKYIFKKESSIISVSYAERWGIYSIYVVVNCLDRKQLYKFREIIPNFFEGWEVKIIPVSLLAKIFFFLRRIIKGK